MIAIRESRASFDEMSRMAHVMARWGGMRGEACRLLCLAARCPLRPLSPTPQLAAQSPAAMGKTRRGARAEEAEEAEVGG